MSSNTALILESLGLIVLTVIFVLLLRAGYFLKISAYWNQMMDEMKKCTWPTWDELTGSTVLVFVTVGMFGIFTVGVDFIFTFVIKALTS